MAEEKQETQAVAQVGVLGEGTLTEVKNKKNTFTVTDRHGNKVTLKVGRAPAMMLQRIASDIKRPDRPTYTVELYGGKKQSYPLDEAAAKSFAEEGTEEGMAHFRAWTEYRQAMEEADAAYMERMMRAMFFNAVEFDLPGDQSYFLEDEFLGFEVPEQERFRKVHYLMNHLRDADVVTLLSRIMAATGVDEQIVADAEAAFRGSVRNEQ